MAYILRTALVLAFIAGLSSTYVYKVLRACDGACGGRDEYSSYESGGHAVQTKAEVKGGKTEAVIDPVCGMTITDIKKAPSEEYKGKAYYFCSKDCEKTFQKNPAPYTCECVTKMKGCECAHCKGKEDACRCPLGQK